MSRTGPKRHSRHEFATSCAARLKPSQSEARRATASDSRTPAATSAIACIPVVTQLAAIAHANAAKTGRARGHREDHARAARKAPAAWKEGNALEATSCARSKRSRRASAPEPENGRGGAESGSTIQRRAQAAVASHRE